MLDDYEDKAVFEIRPAAIIAWIFLLSYLGAPDWMYYLTIAGSFILNISDAPYWMKGYLAVPAFILWMAPKIAWVFVADLIGASTWFYVLILFAGKKGVLSVVIWITVLYLIDAPWWMYLLGIFA